MTDRAESYARRQRIKSRILVAECREYCRSTAYLFFYSLAEASVGALGAALVVTIPCKILGATWNTTLVLDACVAALVLTGIATWNFLDALDTRSYYERLYHSQISVPSATAQVLAHAQATHQIGLLLHNTYAHNLTDSHSIFNAAVSRAHAEARTPVAREQLPYLIADYQNELHTIFDSVHTLRTTPLVREATDRFIQRARQAN